LFLLTATPVNNRLTDLQHMIELFSRGQADYFRDAPLGIHSLPGHFRKMEKDLEGYLNRAADNGEGVQTDLFEADFVLGADALFHALVVQRSRAYVRRSLEAAGDGDILFPRPREPKVQPYSVKQTYGKLLQMVEDAFNKQKPLFSLAIYFPYAYYTGPETDIDALTLGRQKQVVSLIRTQFLKRFESSVHSFRASCWSLLIKLLAWVEVHAESAHEKRLLERWKNQHATLINYAQTHQLELFGEPDDRDADEDVIPEEMLEAVEKLPRDKFKVDEIIDETLLDLDQIASFLKELDKFKPSQDKKLQALLGLLKKDAVLSKHKVLIFSEFMTTARYLKQQLIEAGIEGVEEIDSASKADRGEVITRFSPYYNGFFQRRTRRRRENGDPRAHRHRRVVGRPEPAGRHAHHQLRPALEPGATDAAHRPRGPAHGPRNRSTHRRRPPRPEEAARRDGLLELPAARGTGRTAAPLPHRIEEDAAYLQDLRHRGPQAADARRRLPGVEGIHQAGTQPRLTPSRMLTHGRWRPAPPNG
jgi:hypothetical protein